MSPKNEEELSLPDGWEPGADLDDSWRTIRQLMADADQPIMPPPAMFEAVRQEVRRDLIEEGFLRDKPGSTEPGFREWLNLVLFGGRTGGQLVRLGMAAGLAFFIGTSMNGGDQAQPAIDSPTITERDTNPAIASAPADSDSDTVVASAITPSPTPLSQGGPGGAIGRSIWEDTGWDDTAPASQAWMYENGFGPKARTVAARAEQPAATTQPQHAPQGNGLASQALEQLQMLKFRALVNHDEKTLEEIRRVEQTIAQIVGEVGWESGNRQAALTSYRRGEQALAARRYYDAQRYFGAAADMAPGSFLSFLATFQIGRVAFEWTEDFATARQAYRECLQEFPPQFLTGDSRQLVVARLERLEATRDNDWESLRLWQVALRAPNVPQAVSSMHDALSATNYAPLIGDLAGKLSEMLIEDATGSVDPQPSIELIRDKLAGVTNPRDAARLHLAIGDIANQRLDDENLAASEYRLAWEKSSDPEFRQLVSQRLRPVFKQQRQNLAWPVTE